MLTDDEIAWDAAPHLAGADWQRCDEHERACYRDAIREALAALRSAGLALEQGWRFDMDTAPRDGTWILIFLPDDGNGPETIVEAQWVSTLDGHWAEAFSDAFIEPNAPTAWRPRLALPAPPTDSKGGAP